MAAKYTVIYVMADVRSGSTLLENILSKSDETVSVGEIALLKNHIFRKGAGFRWDWNCSCGSPIPTCVFWSEILKNIDTSSQDFNTAIDWNYKSNRMLAGSFLPAVFKKNLQNIQERKINQVTITILTALYKNIFQLTGKRFIIDSSKDPVQAYSVYINKPPDFDVKIIGLKRDLRAIAASKKKWNILNKKNINKSLGKLLRNSLFYNKICNQVLKLTDAEDRLLISYENLAVHTQEQIDKIIAKTGMQPFKAPEYMQVEDDHTIAGTPQRFTKKPITYDDTWKEAYSKKPLLSLAGKIMNKL